MHDRPPALPKAPDAPPTTTTTAPAPRRGRLFRTRSGNLVDAPELRRRRRLREAQQQQQQQQQRREEEERRERDEEEALLAAVMDGVGRLSASVDMRRDEAGRWRIRRTDPPSPSPPPAAESELGA